ncbi:hypothetical protein AB0I90_23165 [Micromonospora wenchangensis]|uniref:hypothetical protein n=1 Tax=Micromonospora TaxID=1873 RepID=UPI0033C40B1D
MWDIRLAICVAVSAALLAVATLIILALWFAGFPAFKSDGIVSAATLFDLLKLAFAVVAGIGGAIALVVAYRRQRVTEAANRIAEFSNSLAKAADERAEATRILAEAADERARAAEARSDLEVERNGVRLLNERFAKAAEQLGSDKAAVRLAGVYSMAGLADDWIQGRQTCVDVLCGYLRMPYGGSDSKNDEEFGQERQVRRTVLRVVASRLTEQADVRWDGLTFDFTGAVVEDGDLTRLRLDSGTRLIFRNATVTGNTFNLTSACFRNGLLDFTDAKISATVALSHARLCGGKVTFERARMKDVPSLAGTQVDSGSLIFESAKFSTTSINVGYYLSGGMLHIKGGRVSFASAEIKTRYYLSVAVRMSGGELDFSFADFTAKRFSMHESAISGGLINFEFAKLEVESIDFTKMELSGGLIDMSKVWKWPAPPVTEDARIGGSEFLTLPGPDWQFENEPPF